LYFALLFFEPGAHAAQAKDCAVYLVMALAGRTRTAAAGAKAVNELVNVADFFRTQVAPDIQSTDANLVRTPAQPLSFSLPALPSSQDLAVMYIRNMTQTHKQRQLPLPAGWRSGLYCHAEHILPVVRSRRCCGRTR
jgi:Cse1